MNKLAEKISKEIHGSGPISFRKFMEMALYCPVCGYYEKEEDKIGLAGDFYTSVSSSPLFGQLLAFQSAKWLKIITSADSKPDTRLTLVEAGAHHGDLAAEVLNWFRKHQRELFSTIDYVIIEPSERRRRIQQHRLSDFPQVAWAEDWPGIFAAQRTPGNLKVGPAVPCRPGPLKGVIFSNELLDTMPVHRLGWDAAAKAWFEWGVDIGERSVPLLPFVVPALAGSPSDAPPRFVWTRLDTAPPREALPAEAPPELLAVLPDGFTVETCPAAAAWWERAAAALACGVLLTFDYGFDELDFFDPGRYQGTLRSYQRHQVSLDVLSEPGEHDITAHVNFDAIRKTGERAGLQTFGYMTQAQFLFRVAKDLWTEPDRSDSWTKAHANQFQVLTHPEHLGRSFRVLLQQRNLQTADELLPGESH